MKELSIRSRVNSLTLHVAVEISLGGHDEWLVLLSIADTSFLLMVEEQQEFYGSYTTASFIAGVIAYLIRWRKAKVLDEREAGRMY